MKLWISAFLFHIFLHDSGESVLIIIINSYVSRETYKKSEIQLFNHKHIILGLHVDMFHVKHYNGNAIVSFYTIYK